MRQVDEIRHQFRWRQTSSATGVHKAWDKLGCRYVGPQNTIDVNRSEVIVQQYFAVGQAASALIIRQQAKIVTVASNCAPENTHPVIALLVRLMTRLAQSACVDTLNVETALLGTDNLNKPGEFFVFEGAAQAKARLRFGVKSPSDAIVNPMRMACFSARKLWVNMPAAFIGANQKRSSVGPGVVCHRYSAQA